MYLVRIFYHDGHISFTRIALFLVFILGAWQGWLQIRPMIDRPMEKAIYVAGGTFSVTPRMLKSVVYEHLKTATFLTVDVSTIQNAIQHLPWVAKVTIRKKWPNRIEAYITEHVPKYRWNETDLISDKGVRFTPSPEDYPLETLPQLTGPQGMQSHIILLYEFARSSFSSLGFKLDEITMEDRGSVRLVVAGKPILIGRKNLNDRVSRIVSTFKSKSDQIAFSNIEYIDARYAHGLAFKSFTSETVEK